MKKLLRICTVVGLITLLLGVLGVGVLSLMARKYVSREALVEMAEEELNSRVHIGEVDLSLFRLPATVTLREVSLSPRTGEVAKPLAERSPVTDPPVRIKEVRLQVRLGALLKRRVEVTEFVFEEPCLAISVTEEGENSLDELLRSPGPKKRKKPKEEEAVEKVGKGDGDEEDTLNAKSLNVYVHGFLALVREVRMERASLDLTIEKTGMVVKGREIEVKLDEMKVDPAALEKTNTARLHVEGRVEVDAVKDPDVRYAEILVDGGAEATLFDLASGDFQPDLLANLAIGDGSYLNAKIPVIEKGWGLLQKLETFGLEMGELPERAEFGRSRRLHLHYREGRFTLRAPISVWFFDWELAVLENSWVQTEDETHTAEAELLSTGKLTEDFREQLDKRIGKVPRELRPAVLEEIEKTWFRGGRLGVEATSSGPLSEPEIDLLDNVPDIGEIIRKASENFLKNGLPSLLDRLLGDDDDE